MCGIFGLIGKESVSKRLISGAGRMQNRGHRSTKVVTFDGTLFHSHGDLLPATVLFADYDPRKLRGNSGIVHTRYVTAGRTTTEHLMRNIQPVFSDRPGMATCNNGDLINLYSQTAYLKDLGFSFQTEVDAKVIQNTIINHLINLGGMQQDTPDFVDKLFMAVEMAQKDLVGAYCVLCLFETGILAFRDAHGIRPLCMAERLDDDGNIVEVGFASESSVFNYFGDYHNIREVAPGEAIWVSNKDLKPIKRVLHQKREAFCFFEYVYFARPDSIMKNRRVEVVRGQLGEELAKECTDIADRIDVVCGLPGTSISSGHFFAQYLNKQFRRAIIKVDNRRSFQETSDQKRKKAIDEKFIFVRDYIENQRIAVIDDSNVRGTTAKKIVARLYALGAKEVHMLYFTPPIIGPCFYGIDTPDESKLIAFGRTTEQIRAEMGCDTVRYISQEGLFNGLGVNSAELCTACITRNYPTDTGELVLRSQLRQTERLDTEQLEPEEA